jgi:tetratricopeptide (TPR) repeat protein
MAEQLVRISAELRASVKALRRLTAADGYLDLGMAEHALQELAAIEEPGPLEAAVLYIEGEALKSLERYSEAIDRLQRAAELIPAPYNRPAWLSLSECFLQRGQNELAAVAKLFAEESATDDPAANEG